MKKIAILDFNATILGGVERVVCGLAKSFCESGKYSVVVVSLFSSKGTSYYPLPDNVKIIHVGLKYGSIFKYIFLQCFKLTKLCKKEKIDIIIGTLFKTNSFLPFVGNCKIKIGTEHITDKLTTRRWKAMKKIFYPMLDSLVCLTKSDAKNYSYLKNIKVIPNQLPFIPKKQSELKNNVILSVGRLDYQKGFERLIEAISLIKEKCGGWQVKIIGDDGKDKEKLLEQIKKNGLEQTITILPPTDKIEDEYYNAGIYVMSSRYEGFPMVLIEAKSCGLPVVSFDCPDGPAEIIQNNVDGFLVEEGDVEALSQAILKLIEDEDLRKKFGQEAVKNVRRFSPDNVFEMWDNLFEELEGV